MALLCPLLIDWVVSLAARMPKSFQALYARSNGAFNGGSAVVKDVKLRGELTMNREEALWADDGTSGLV